jgi:hypothetical protein
VDKPTVFISHIVDESALARALQGHLQRDFLGLLDVFVSSDGESISAGANWLSTISEALKRTKLEVVVCSRASVNRPWVNFEAGAAWIRDVPIVPVCHSGLRPTDLPMPLRVLNGIEARDAAGLSSLYKSVARVLNSSVPRRDFDQLVSEVAAFEASYSPQLRQVSGDQDRRHTNAIDRMKEGLRDESYDARSVQRLAVMGGISVSEALDLLRADPDVVFDWSDSLGRLARLKSRQTG